MSALTIRSLFLRKHTTSLNTYRHFSKTFTLNEIFKIQDEEDYQKRVVNSKEPVILDFYAT